MSGRSLLVARRQRMSAGDPPPPFPPNPPLPAAASEARGPLPAHPPLRGGPLPHDAFPAWVGSAWGGKQPPPRGPPGGPERPSPPASPHFSAARWDPLARPRRDRLVGPSQASAVRALPEALPYARPPPRHEAATQSNELRAGQAREPKRRPRERMSCCGPRRVRAQTRRGQRGKGIATASPVSARARAGCRSLFFPSQRGVSTRPHPPTPGPHPRCPESAGAFLVVFFFPVVCCCTFYSVATGGGGVGSLPPPSAARATAAAAVRGGAAGAGGLDGCLARRGCTGALWKRG